MAGVKCCLIGPNGCGKTTVGRMLANFLSLKFVDLDLELTNLCGGNLIDLWVSKGSEVFGELEKTIIQTLAVKRNTIFSASVNSMINPYNRKLLRSHAKVVYLSADPVNQYTRSMLAKHDSPILFNVSNKLQHLIELEKTMQPVYSSIADLIIATDNFSIEEVTNRIIDFLYCGIYS